MDLSSLFEDQKVKKGTHVVMKSVGLEKGGDFKGWIHAPKLNDNNEPAHELYPINRVKAMEEQGWQLVKQVKEPTDAKTTRKAKENVEG